MCIIKILNSKRTDSWLRKSFDRLKPNQIKFIEEYLKVNQDVEFNEFHKKLNRLFIIDKFETLNRVTYRYEEVFPMNKKGHHPNVSIAQELISAVFNEYHNKK